MVLEIVHMRRRCLLLCFVLLGVVSSARAQTMLNFGEALTGTIGSGQLGASYTFEGQAGDTVYVTMFAPNSDLEPELQLTGPGGTLLAREVDNNVTGALIGPLTLQDGGTYTVLATGADGSSGDFSLLVDRAEWTPLPLGETVSGAFSQPGAMRFFTFEGDAGNLIRYWIKAPNVGIRVITPSDSVYTDGVYDNPFRYFTILPESGGYQVGIMTTNPGGTDYEFALLPVDAQPLISGQSLTGTITESNPLVFTFDSAAGKMWQLNARVTDASYATGLQVYNGNDPSYGIAGDGASGPEGFPRVEPFIAPEDATYYVVLEFDDYTDDDATRDYEISLAPSSLFSLSPGQAIESKVTPESGNAVYAYHGKAGEVIRVTLTRTGETGAPGLLVWSQVRQDTLFDFSTYVELRSASVEIVLPDDGMYLLTVRNQDSEATELAFSILVERTG